MVRKRERGLGGDKEHVIKEVIKKKDERNAVVGGCFLIHTYSFILFFESLKMQG